jgi:hypothetical protein
LLGDAAVSVNIKRSLELQRKLVNQQASDRLS